MGVFWPSAGCGVAASYGDAWHIAGTPRVWDASPREFNEESRREYGDSICFGLAPAWDCPRTFGNDRSLQVGPASSLLTRIVSAPLGPDSYNMRTSLIVAAALLVGVAVVAAGPAVLTADNFDSTLSEGSELPLAPAATAPDPAYATPPSATNAYEVVDRCSA